MLEDPALAEYVVGNEDADLVAIARGLLRDPYWATHAAVAKQHGDHDRHIPEPYTRAY
ncbi:NADPH dehydrogenase [compost metagenome]